MKAVEHGCVGKRMIYSIIYSITVRKERRGEKKTGERISLIHQIKGAWEMRSSWWYFIQKKIFSFSLFSLLLPDNNRYQQMSNTRMQRPGARDWTLHSPQEVKNLKQIWIFSFVSFNSFYLIAPSICLFLSFFLCIDSGRLCSLSGCPRKDKVTPESK